MSKVAIQGNASGTGTFTIAAPNSNTDRTLTLPDEAGTVLTSGGPISVGGLVTLTNGGIKFPASQVASADGNTLDDYEEGTWTPSYTSLGNCSSIATSSAVYTKVGRIVHFYITGTFTVTSSGVATYFGFSLPFAQDTNSSGGCGTINYGNITNNTGHVIEWDGTTGKLGVWVMATNNIESGSAKPVMVSGTYTAS